MRIAIFDGESRSLRRTLDYQKCVLINDIATIVNIGHKELYFRHSNIYHDKMILILEYMYDYVMFSDQRCHILYIQSYNCKEEMLDFFTIKW